jgi:hypothetical protein
MTRDTPPTSSRQERRGEPSVSPRTSGAHPGGARPEGAPSDGASPAAPFSVHDPVVRRRLVRALAEAVRAERDAAGHLADLRRIR